MSNHLSSKDWDFIMESVEKNVHYQNSQQQNLFRFFQFMKKPSPPYDLMDEAIDSVGISLDIPLLLKEGAVPMASQFCPPELPSLTEITPLGWAASQNNTELMQWLLDNFAERTIVFGSQSMDAAWLAMELKKSEALELLLEPSEFNADWQLNDSKRTYRLLRAVQLSYYSGVKYLLQKNAKVNVYDMEGKTALHYNFANNPYSQEDEMIAELLVKHGANPAVEDKLGVPVSALAHNEFHERLLHTHGLEKVILPAVPNEMEGPEISPDSDNILRPEPGQPTVPQLKKPPKLNVPRF